MKKVLIPGGAGFVGCVLVPMLLNDGYIVRVLDNLMYGGSGLLGCSGNPNFQFQKGDVRNSRDVIEAVKGCDVIVHLAGIVGFPACRKDTQRTNSINVDGSRIVVSAAASGQLSIFSSTGSVYGDISDVVCTEETEPKPISLYSQNKVEAEKFFLDADGIVLRFATGFGVSPRMRLDLMVADFVHRAITQKQIIIYEWHFMRTFINVLDMCGAIVFSINNSEKMRGQIYNVGDDSLNISKLGLCELIQKKVDYYLHCAEVEKDEDKRNCIISYEKMKGLGFSTAVSLEQGIEEIAKAIPLLDFQAPYSNV